MGNESTLRAFVKKCKNVTATFTIEELEELEEQAEQEKQLA